MYVNFVTRKYSDASVVFDGYDTGGTKDMTHVRRTKGVVGRSVSFYHDMTLFDKKGVFLSKSQNKQKFVNLLCSELQEKGIKSFQVVEDADCLIIKEALEKAESFPTIVIGEDTDLLFLLLYHLEERMRDIILVSGSAKKDG